MVLCRSPRCCYVVVLCVLCVLVLGSTKAVFGLGLADYNYLYILTTEYLDRANLAHGDIQVKYAS